LSISSSEAGSVTSLPSSARPASGIVIIFSGVWAAVPGSGRRNRQGKRRRTMTRMPENRFLSASKGNMFIGGVLPMESGIGILPY